MRIALTTEEFIRRSKHVHGDRYDYGLTVYTKSSSKVSIVCKTHGKFEQVAASHLAGWGCNKCRIATADKSKLITKANTIHNSKYTYDLVSYTRASDKVKIKCPTHGIFEQIWANHLRGYGCPSCFHEGIKGRSYSNTEDFVIKAQQIHRELYDYSSVNYVNAKTKVDILCKTHGMFQQVPSTHLSGHGCPLCRTSKGELQVNEWLTKNQIRFISQMTFDGCVYKNKLPFDFYIPSMNICIEYDGEQHFKRNSHFHRSESDWESLKQRDEIKARYCEEMGMGLLRIRFDEDVEAVLTKKISTALCS